MVDHPGDRHPAAPARPELTPLGYALGASSLAAALAATLWLVLELCGYTPEALLGLEIGLVLGLASLAAELAVLDRAQADPFGTGVQATLTTFVMRLAVVAPLTVWFGRADAPADAQAFALSYCATFFIYLCWLTWRTATAPVCYQGARRPAAPSDRALALSRRLGK